MSKLTVSLVDDIDEVRIKLEQLITKSPDFQFLASFGSAEEAIKKIPTNVPDILIMDIGLPKMNGIDCVEKIREDQKEVLITMYTVFDESDDIFESLKAGANGYLLKHNDDQALLDALKDLANGGSPMSPSIARKVTEFFFARPRKKKEKVKSLTKREIELLDLLSKGFLYKEIASQMGITTGTVKQHIHKIYRKLHVQNKTEAINLYFDR